MRRLLMVGLVMFSVASNVLSATEAVQGKEHTFKVKYKDGSIEQYKTRWVATRDLQVSEDGHPSEPLKGWFTDTRTCHWTATGQVERRVTIVNKNGKEFEDASRYQVFHSASMNEGSPFVLTQLRPENCNDAAARRASDYENVRKALLASFEELVQTDFNRVIADFKKDGEITVGP